MKKTNLNLIKKLREETGISIMECRKALEETKGNLGLAKKILFKKGAVAAEKKSNRETKEGVIEAYVHQTGKSGVLLEVLCETDFVARNEDFKKFSHEVAMQICAMEPKTVEALLKQEYIRDSEKTIEDLKNELVAKVGENIKIGRFVRYSL